MTKPYGLMALALLSGQKFLQLELRPTVILFRNLTTGKGVNLTLN